MTVMIDTLKFAKNFEMAGFAKPQAEALTTAMAEMTSMAREDLVTKTDLRLAVGELRNEISALGVELRSEIAAIGTELRSEIAAMGTELRSEISGQGGLLRTEMAGLRTEMAVLNASTRSQLLWAMFGGQFVVISALVALSKFGNLFN